MTNILELAQIPDDLAAEAAQVPGLHLRLVSFIRAEVSQHNRRKVRRSMEARRLVEQARAEVEASSAMSEEEKASARREFAIFYEQIMNR